MERFQTELNKHAIDEQRYYFYDLKGTNINESYTELKLTLVESDQHRLHYHYHSHTFLTASVSLIDASSTACFSSGAGDTSLLEDDVDLSSDAGVIT